MRVLAVLKDDDKACQPLLLGNDAGVIVAVLRDDRKVPVSLKESDRCVSTVEAESDLVLCVPEWEDEAKLVELLKTCDEEPFVDRENPEDEEVVVASPSAATALMIHIVVQVIIVSGFKSLVVSLEINSLNSLYFTRWIEFVVSYCKEKTGKVG